MISGVPRIKELLSVSKEIKSPFVDVYLDPDFVEDKSRAKVIANNIEYTTLRAFTQSIDVYFDPNPRDTIIAEDKEFVKAFFKYSLRPINVSKLSKFMLRIKLNKKLMIYKQMRMFYIKYMIESFGHGQYEVIHSDDNAENLVLHIRINMSLVTQKTKDELELIQQEKDVILDDVVIRGIKDITSAQIGNGGDKLIVYDPETGDRKQVDQWAVYTSGTNLIKVLAQPGVDPIRTSSNDVAEIFKLFGIEAARQLLYNQLNTTYSETGATINFHHLSLLVDLQTYFGQLMPISRHGINRTDNSPITKASFEETLEQLSEAAGYAAHDNMHGISANIAAGQMMPAGTGALFDLVYDAQETGVSETEVEAIFGGDDEDW